MMCKLYCHLLFDPDRIKSVLIEPGKEGILTVDVHLRIWDP